MPPDMTPPVIQSFVSAAQHGDIAQMHALVDWALSGGPKMARSLYGVSNDQRAGIAMVGWAELQDNIVSDHKLISRLNTLALRLQRLANVRAATTAERNSNLAELHVTAPRAHLPPDVLEGLNAISQRAKAVSLVYFLETLQGAPLVVALAPDGQQLVLLD